MAKQVDIALWKIVYSLRAQNFYIEVEKVPEMPLVYEICLADKSEGKAIVP